MGIPKKRPKNENPKNSTPQAETHKGVMIPSYRHHHDPRQPHLKDKTFMKK
jgi:hypothetical protein